MNQLILCQRFFGRRNVWNSPSIWRVHSLHFKLEVKRSPKRVLPSNLEILEPLDPTLYSWVSSDSVTTTQISSLTKVHVSLVSCAERRVSFPSYHRPALSEHVHFYSHSQDGAFWADRSESFNIRCWAGIVVVKDALLSILIFLRFRIYFCFYLNITMYLFNRMPLG